MPAKVYQVNPVSSILTSKGAGMDRAASVAVECRDVRCDHMRMLGHNTSGRISDAAKDDVSIQHLQKIDGPGFHVCTELIVARVGISEYTERLG